jgi:hypothetical protein
MEEATDDELLAYAADHGFIVVSHDVNTMPAAVTSRLELGELIAGVFLISQAMPVRQAIDDLCLIWSASEASEWQGQVSYLPI